VWDQPYYRSAPQTPGNITSSFGIISAITNTRKLYLTNTPLFLTKKVSKAHKTFEIPNVFSPNGDNINDRWNIKGLAEYDNCVVEIYNRYGQMLFRSNGYRQPWDGTYKGAPLPVATYYYIINLAKGERPVAGSVTILR
jgi:gliding motility-associated-like protein